MHPLQAGWRDYVIGTLPQLLQLDGKEISKSERIKALQRLEALERELAPLAEMARDRKAERRDRRAARLREREAAGSDFESDGEGVDEWCVEVRVEDAREMREAKEKQEEAKAKSKRQDQELLGSLTLTLTLTLTRSELAGSMSAAPSAPRSYDVIVQVLTRLAGK